VRALDHGAVGRVGQAGQEGVLEDGHEGRGAADEEIDVLAPLGRVEDHVVRALIEGVAQVEIVHGLVAEAAGHHPEGRPVPDMGELGRTEAGGVVVAQGEGRGVLQHQALQLAGHQVGLQTHLVAVVQGPGPAVFERDEVAVNDEAQGAVLPAVGHVAPGRCEVRVLEVLGVDHDLDVHVLGGDGQGVFVLLVLPVLVALGRGGPHELLAQDRAAAPVGDAHQEARGPAEGVDALVEVPAVVLLAQVQGPGPAEGERGLVDDRILDALEADRVEGHLLGRELARAVVVGLVQVEIAQLAVLARGHGEVLHFVHVLEDRGQGELERPVPGRGDERQLGVGLLVVVGDVIEPDAVAGLVDEHLLPLLEGQVRNRALGRMQLEQVGLLAEDEERIAHERADLVHDLGNVVQAACWNGRRAGFYRALAQHHCLRQLP